MRKLLELYALPLKTSRFPFVSSIPNPFAFNSTTLQNLVPKRNYSIEAPLRHPFCHCSRSKPHLLGNDTEGLAPQENMPIRAGRWQFFPGAEDIQETQRLHTGDLGVTHAAVCELSLAGWIGPPRSFTEQNHLKKIGERNENKGTFP
jgi:hypothetical protein